MEINLQKMYETLLDEIFAQRKINPEDIPAIDVYMDQLTSFMDERLRTSTRNPEMDKVLTKTMINNYTKNDLLPPPVKKKYSREHLILLIYIFYLKSTQSIDDIGEMIEPLRHLFEEGEGAQPNLVEVYRETLQWVRSDQGHIRADLDRMLLRASRTFPEVAGEKQAELKRFSFLTMLAYDLFVRQTLFEKLLDGIREAKKAAGVDEKDRRKAKAKDKKREDA